MGVKGLSSFMKEHAADCLIPVQLNNKLIIVDGNNLMFQMFYSIKQNYSIFGGDYDKVYKFAKSFMMRFQECDLRLLIIFDGCADPTESKFKLKLKRMQESIQSGLKSLPCSQNKSRVLSLLVPNIFVDVLNELEINFINCLYEADAHIATLAKILDCPVVSDDSDFYVHDVAFIQASSVGSDVVTDGNGMKYLQCSMFDRRKFADKFKINLKLLPLFGTLLGNDYVPLQVVSNIYNHVSLPKKKKMNEQHRRIFGLLGWFHDQDVDFAIDKHLEAFKREEREKVDEVIRNGLLSYGKLLHAHVWDLLSQLDIFNDVELPGDIMLLEESCSCPDWLLKLIFFRKIPPLVWQIYSRDVLLTDSQVECVHLLSCNISSFPIINVIHFIVHPSGCCGGDLTVFCRRKGHLNNWLLDPFKSNYSAEFKVTIDNIPNLSIEHRRSYFMNVMHVSSDYVDFLESNIPSECHFYFFAIFYWIQTSSVKVKEAHVFSLLLCYLLMYGVEHLKGCESRNIKYIIEHQCLEAIETNGHISVADILLNVSNGECMQVKLKLLRFFTINEKVKQKNYVFDRKTVHCFNELQSVYKYAQALNELLLKPVDDCCIGLLYNGTFLYTMSQELLIRKDSWDFVYSELSSCPNFVRALQILTGYFFKWMKS